MLGFVAVCFCLVAMSGGVGCAVGAWVYAPFGGVRSGCCGLVLSCLGLAEKYLVRVLSLGSSFGCCCVALVAW